MNIKENKQFKSFVSSAEKTHGKGYVGTTSTDRPMTVERFAEICTAIYSAYRECKVSYNDYIMVREAVQRIIQTELQDRPL